MKIDGDEIKEFIKTAVQSIREGLDEADCHIGTKLEFELGVVKTSEAKGGFKIIVANASGQLSEQHISKIKFDVYPNPNKVLEEKTE